MTTDYSQIIAHALLCAWLTGPLLAPSARAADGVPSVRFAPALTTGGLDAAVVAAGLEQRVKAIERCYAPALNSDPTVYGQVQVDLGVDAAGQVTTATLSGSTVSGSTVSGSTVSGSTVSAEGGAQAAGAGAGAGADIASCVAGVLQVVPMATAPSAQPATARVVVLLAPTSPSHPRKKLAAALSACATGESSAVSQGSLLARVDVDGGRPTAIQIKSIPALDPQVEGCMRLALGLGPYTVGVGARLYQWDLPSGR